MPISIAQLLGEAQRRLGVKRRQLARYAEQLVLPLDEHAVLVESRHGDALEGNMYYVAHELLSSEAYAGMKVYVTANAAHRGIVERQVATLPPGATVLDFESDAYLAALARSKYLFNDTCFRPCFAKREGQIYANTWHGTPLKHLGRSVAAERASIGNVQRNLLCCDYLLFPNEHTRNVLLDDYMVRGLGDATMVFGGYPRNAALLDEALRIAVRDRFGLAGKRVYAIMPTYRGTREAVDDAHVLVLRALLDELDGLLCDDEVAYLHLHPFMAGRVECAQYARIRDFPAEIPVYDFLAAVDGLITDYSSLMFDFACTGRPISLFVADLDEYRAGRGLYFDVLDLGLPCAYAASDALAALRGAGECAYGTFRDRFCRFENANAVRDFVKLVVKGERADSFVAADDGPAQLPAVLVRVDGLEPGLVADTLRRHFGDPELARRRYYVAFSAANPAADDIVSALPQSVGYFATAGAPVLSEDERWAFRLRAAMAKRSPRDFCSQMHGFQEREWRRRFGRAGFREVVDLGVYDFLNALVFACGSNCSTVLASRYASGVPAAQPTVDEIACLLLSGADVSTAPDWLEDRLSPPDPKEGFRFALLATRFNVRRGRGLGFDALLAASFDYPQYLGDMRLRVGDSFADASMTPIVGGADGNPLARGLGLYRLRVNVSQSLLAHLGEENRMAIVFEHDGRVVCRRAITYKALRKGCKSLHGPLLRFSLPADSSSDARRRMVAYFRQTRNNTIILTVRNRNVTDGRMARLKLAVASVVAKLPSRQAPVLVYEKNAVSYAESGKAVFEELCARGHGSLRFVVGDTCKPDDSAVPSSCRGKFVATHSFAHYLAFFRARTLLGTELPVHAVERNTVSRLVNRHVNDPDVTWVFLQHGVMYMVSLDAFQRAYFRRPAFGCRVLVSVSSEVEARHFVELGGYKSEEMLVSGLAKFDTAVQDAAADKIVVMPTWRQWDNALALEGGQTGYERLVERIVAAVPPELRSHVVICPHPLAGRSAPCTSSGGASMRDVAVFGSQTGSIDALLRKARVLVTDYSSVAYDAFFRGANVVFYWEELDECMARYGAPAHLMLNDGNAFGYVARTSDGLTRAVAQAFNNPQSPEHMRKFTDIVGFRDGRNTKRLADLLEERIPSL